MQVPYINRAILLKLLIPFVLGLGIIFTFSKEIVIAYYFGSAREVEIYRIAFSIPYALFQSLGSILVGGLLPILITTPTTFNIIKNNIYKVFIIIFIFMLLTVTWQADILAPGFNDFEKEVLVKNLLISWFIFFFSSLIIPNRLILQKNDKKLLVASTSLLFSFFFILLLLLFQASFKSYILSLISVVAIVFIYIIYSLESKKHVLANNVLKTINKEVSRKIYKIILGSFIYVLFLALPRIIDRAIASKMQEGVIANLDYAMNFYVAFGVLIGTAFTIIYAKKIATQYKTKSKNLKWLSIIIGIPFLIATFIILIIFPFSEELVEFSYLRGNFNTSDMLQVSEILVWFLIALPFMVANMIMSQIMIAHSILILLVVVIFKVLVKLLFIYFLFEQHSLVIFGMSTLVMEICNCCFIIIFLLKYKMKKCY